jgi:hypothetical protein
MEAIITMSSRGVLTFPATLRRSVGLKPDGPCVAEGARRKPALTLSDDPAGWDPVLGRVRAALSDHPGTIQAICRMNRDRGGFRMSWVGRAEADRGRTIRPVASAGYEEGYLERVGISWVDTERGRGPAATAIRERLALPGVRAIGLTMHTGKDLVSAMVEAGAEACLDKAGPFDALLASIRAG